MRESPPQPPPPQDFADIADTYQSLLDTIQDGLFILEDARVTFVNEALAAMLGQDAQELIGRDFRELVAPEDRDMVTDRYWRRQAGEEVPQEYELRLLRPDGRGRLAAHLRVGTVSKRGRVATMGTIKDVTARRRAEEALRQSERRFRELAEMLPETVFETDRAGRLELVSDSAYEVFGYSPADFEAGVSCFDILAPGERERGRANFGQVLGGEPRGLTEYLLSRKDGNTFPALIRSAPIVRDGEVVGLRGVIVDLSERKRLEEQLRRSERMEALGTLAGGIAHDFNNLLMGIQGHASLMLVDMDRPNPHGKHLDGIEACVTSASALTRQLLAFARGGAGEVKSTDLSELAHDAVGLFARTRKDVRTVVRASAEPCFAQVDRTQIEHVIVNLLVNAGDAMPDGGDLLVETRVAPLGAAEAEALGIEAGSYARIVVSDTGVGIDASTRERIFEPFFTTRELGGGTGLGLATAYGFVRGHAGSISVTSELGQGATFEVLLPATEEAAMASLMPRGEVALGSGTILLVDDEPTTVYVGRKMLERLGYHVTATQSGEEAVRIFADQHRHIDLVVLDIVMPGMCGNEVFRKIRGIDPKCRVLVASGYGPGGQAEALLRAGCDGFLPKPFDLQQLSQKVSCILTSARASD